MCQQNSIFRKMPKNVETSSELESERRRNTWKVSCKIPVLKVVLKQLTTNCFRYYFWFSHMTSFIKSPLTLKQALHTHTPTSSKNRY